MTLLRKYVLPFSGFTDFEIAVTLLLVKIILNFYNGKKATFKLFLQPLINFFIQWSLNAQNAVWMGVPHPIFAWALWCNREYLGWGGGGECEEPAILNSLHAHIRSGTKGASAIGPQLWGEVFSIGGRGPKCQFSSGLFGPHASRCAFHKLSHRKGLMPREIEQMHLEKIKYLSPHFCACDP
jgi:hypothetical protein